MHPSDVSVQPLVGNPKLDKVSLSLSLTYAHSSLSLTYTHSSSHSHTHTCLLTHIHAHIHLSHTHPVDIVPNTTPHRKRRFFTVAPLSSLCCLRFALCSLQLTPLLLRSSLLSSLSLLRPFSALPSSFLSVLLLSSLSPPSLLCLPLLFPLCAVSCRQWSPPEIASKSLPFAPLSAAQLLALPSARRDAFLATVLSALAGHPTPDGGTGGSHKGPVAPTATATASGSLSAADRVHTLLYCQTICCESLVANLVVNR